VSSVGQGDDGHHGKSLRHRNDVVASVQWYVGSMSRLTRASALLLLVALVAACKRPTATVTPAPEPSAAPSSSQAAAASTHDLAHPPIDCPLHQQGIDPTQLRPFEDVEKYIAFLERADRAEWQKPDEVVAALKLKGNEVVADVGAGSGYFSFRLARAVPEGRVVAGDVEPEMIRHIHHRAMTEGVTNLQAVLVKPDDPQIPNGADWIFICDVLHHVPDRPAWLRRMAEKMKPGARVALIEFKEGELPAGPPPAAKIPKADLIELMKGAGLVADREITDLLPYQVFLVFRKP
jgi:2-polyprenyl-3-methyl-5-hydroxy-6-metoxy-1,4-benzoquinol methylase